MCSIPTMLHCDTEETQTRERFCDHVKRKHFEANLRCLSGDAARTAISCRAVVFCGAACGSNGRCNLTHKNRNGRRKIRKKRISRKKHYATRSNDVCNSTHTPPPVTIGTIISADRQKAARLGLSPVIRCFYARPSPARERPNDRPTG